MASARDFRFRRACYDKPHRCPGWAGGGFRFPKTTVCPGGSIDYVDSIWYQWRFDRHDVCGTIRLPIVLRWLDPMWVSYAIRNKIADRKYWREMR